MNLIHLKTIFTVLVFKSRVDQIPIDIVEVLTTALCPFFAIVFVFVIVIVIVIAIVIFIVIVVIVIVIPYSAGGSNSN